jgi:hypothetical protein
LEDDDDPEELMCSTARSNMVLDELTGTMELRMADGSAVVPSDKMTNREKFEILQERIGARQLSHTRRRFHFTLVNTLYLFIKRYLSGYSGPRF